MWTVFSLKCATDWRATRARENLVLKAQDVSRGIITGRNELWGVMGVCIGQKTINCMFLAPVWTFSSYDRDIPLFCRKGQLTKKI